MQTEARVVLLTGNGLRHRYVMAQLAQSTRLAGVVSEGKAPVVAAPALLPPADQEVIHRHFAERDAVEKRLLGAAAPPPETGILEIPHGTVNSGEVLSWVREREPDFVLLYGSGIIKPPLLERYEGRVVNLHLGLSPYYRGSGTNFWPLANGEPECVGATLHLAVRDVDAGAILAQVRPHPEPSDRAHELGTKTIIAGIALLPRVLALYREGRLQPQGQDLSQGRVYRNRDFNAEAVRALWRRLDGGMVPEYIARMPERRDRYPIRELPAPPG
jgi:methionyl-tRNA formyltransferase